MTRVVLVTTGGTIASRHTAADGGQTVADLGSAALRAALHDDLAGIDLVVDEFCTINSFAFDLPRAFDLSRRIAAHCADPAVAGVVVTHGTDTMEESAFLADITVDTDKPIVFTGAQRPADTPDADGPRNLAEAVRLAAADAARGLGAMVAFEGEFHAARDVSKTHASRVDTFASGEHGKLGEIDGTRVVVQRRPLLRRVYAPPRIEPAVDLLKMTMGDDGRLVRFAGRSGAKAIVIEGFGRGNTPPAVTAVCADLIASGLPVIVTSRCPRGRVRPIYGNGGARDLERAGAIFAGDLSGPKARLLAAVLLGLGMDGEAMRSQFDVLGG